MKGLAILLIDYLASAKVDGYADETAIASDLRLSQKNIRKTLRYLEGERLVAAETVKFSFKRKNAEDPDDPEVEERRRRETHVFWCLDYPRMMDALRLRLHRVRETLRKQVEGMEVLQQYICPRCGAQFSSLDAMALLDPMAGVFRCEHCQGELIEHVEGPGAAGAAGVASRRERQAYFKDLLGRLEAQLKPIVEQLEKLRDVPAPDYGPLQDWYQAKREEAARRTKRLEAARKKVAAAGGAAGAELTEEQLLEWAERAEVVVALPGQEVPGGAAAAAAAMPGKELPAWFRGLDEGAASASVGAGVEESAAAAAGAEEQRRRLEQQYLEQYLAQVRQAQTSMAGGVNGGVDADDSKRMKLEESVKMEEGVKEEEGAVKPVEERKKHEEEIAWEDADEPAAQGDVAAMEDEGFEWEDA